MMFLVPSSAPNRFWNTVVARRERGVVPVLLLGLVALGSCGGDSPTAPAPETPVIQDPPAGFLRFTSLSAGESSVCGLDGEGETYCWGAGFGGDTGGDRPRRLTPTHPFAAVQVHGMWGLFLCGLTAEGAAHCHRRGEFVTVAAPAPFTAIAAGAANCALTDGGTAHCWTYDTGAGIFAGVLGDDGASAGSYIEGTTVPVAGEHRFGIVASTHLTACGITLEHRAYCWGQNNFALQIGDGDASEWGRRAPSPVAGGHEFVGLSLAPNHACGLTPGDLAYCWGFASFGQLGNPVAATIDCPGLTVGTQPGACAASPVPVAGGHRFTTIAAGWYHSCALDRDGRAFCWGANAWGQLGNGKRGAGIFEFIPVAVAGDLRFRALVAGEFFTCGIASNDATYCWGINQAGQLGAGLHPGEVLTVPHPVTLPQS
jgi:alpha-tubulin suppressor-like RCC1 family protein